MKNSANKSVPPPAATPPATIMTDTSDSIMSAADEQRKRLKTAGYRGSVLAGLLGTPETQQRGLLG